MIVAIEGIDGSGKATHSKRLAEGIRGARFSFPNYDSPTGALIQSHLKKQWFCELAAGIRESVPGTLDPMVFQALQTVNRLELLPEVNQHIERGRHVIFDRYWQSGYVYGSLDGLDTDWLRLVQERPMPPAHVNILIDVTVEESFKRRPERRDRYESDAPFLEKVRRAYLKLWGGNDTQLEAWVLTNVNRPDWWGMKSGWFIVNGMRSFEETHTGIRGAIEAYMERP